MRTDTLYIVLGFLRRDRCAGTFPGAAAISATDADELQIAGTFRGWQRPAESVLEGALLTPALTARARRLLFAQI